VATTVVHKLELVWPCIKHTYICVHICT